MLQRKLNAIVDMYKELYPDEYINVVEQIKFTRENVIDEFASSKVDSTIERALFELPETLYNLITMKLTPEEANEFSSKKEAREFAKNHPEFCIPESL